MNKLVLISLLITSIFAQKNNWAVLVAGSSGYGNYRHQSDVFHAFHIMKRNGIDPSHIIVMAYDDIANNRRNPLKGRIFNRPNGEDVYGGVQIDYMGDDVTPDTFINVLTGNKDALRGVGNEKVLESDENSNVFIFYSDHGSPGLVAFPAGGHLNREQLKEAFDEMYSKKMYKKLIFYLESCYSGSMFNQYSGLWKGMGIYAVSAANPGESSYACYCGREARVGGVMIGSCLGDLFSVSWMEHTDSVDPKTTTIGQQVDIVKARTLAGSNVCEYGDLSPRNQFIIEYQGDKLNHKSMKFLEYVKAYNKNHKRGLVRNLDAYLFYYRNLALHSNDPLDKFIYEEELKIAIRNQQIFQSFSERLNVPDELQTDTNFKCYESLINAYAKKCGLNYDRDHGNLYVFYNYCAGGREDLGVEAISEICSEF